MKNNSIRKDWELIQTLIENNRKVLDIGCGEGELISKLEKNKNSDARGIDFNGNLVRNALSQGLCVIQGDAEKDLNQYSDESFDYVILSQTLQAMYNPKKVLLEMPSREKFVRWSVYGIIILVVFLLLISFML